MTQVVIRPSSYDYKGLRDCFFEIMDIIGGGEIGKGANVLVKPNLLSPAKPEDAVLTHPLVVRAAVEYVQERGGSPLVADSPAVGAFKRLMRESGIAAALQGLPVACRPFEKSVAVDVGKPFGPIELAAEAVAADVIINLPKLKTHSQMLLTLGVKNLFGCVVGYRKPEWHLRTGVDTAMFARLLVLIHERLKPRFNVLDGILAMEGEGPGKGGKPRPVGLLMGSGSAHALDAAVCRLLAIPSERLPTGRIAGELSCWNGEMELNGRLPLINDFAMPGMEPVLFGPKPMQGFLRRHFTGYPAIEAPRCKFCGECWQICPARAMGQEGPVPEIDYDRCIRCYCCLEVCPHGAIRKRESLPARMIRGLAERLL